MKYEDTPQAVQRIANARQAVENDPRLTGTLEEKIMWYLSTTQTPPIEPPAITGLSGETYSVTWYGVQESVTVGQ